MGLISSKFKNEEVQNPKCVRFDTFKERTINSIEIQVTNNCNLECSYCFQKTKYTDKLLLKDYYQIIDLLFNDIDMNNFEKFTISDKCRRGYFLLYFIGGEPLLEIENIKKCVEYKKKNGALAAIVVRFTENELNRGQIDEFAEFFKEIGVDEVHYAQEHSFAGVKEEYNDEETMRECPHPHGLINFDFLGNLTTCCINWHLVPIFGNIKNKTIKQMWESRQKLKWNDKTRFNTKPCNNCSGAGEKIKGEVRSRRIKFH